MIVYNLNSSFRSTLLNYKQFPLHLNIDGFLKDHNPIKCFCNKYNNSSINSHYSHIITGDVNIVDSVKLCQIIFKCSTFFFFNWDSLHARLNSHYRHGVTRKRNTKRLRPTGNLFRKNLQLKDVCQF